MTSIKARYKIVSDGTPAGTKVYDLKTGERVEHVKEAVWTLNVDDFFAEAHIVLFPVAVEVIGGSDKPAEAAPGSGEG